MSEKLRLPEQQTVTPEANKQHEAHKPLKHEKETIPGFSNDDLEEIRSSIEKNAETSPDGVQEKIRETTENKDNSPTYIGKELIDMAYNRTLGRVRKQLPAPERMLSNFIHQPVVDKISDIGAQTIARPSALFTGGFVSFIGTFIYYYIARHYGYQYNFGVFIFLLISGMATGIILEILWNLVKRKRS